MSNHKIPLATLFGEKTSHRSPTLQKLKELRGIEAPHTLCAQCPLSVWFDQNGPWAFCNHLHRVSHNTSTPSPIAMCDAREAAIAILDEEGK